MATSVQRFELKVHINFFAGLNSHEQTFVLILLKFAGVQVDAVFRIHPAAMLREQPVHAVERAALLIGGQSENQIAVRYVSFLFQADEIRDQDGIAFLHVLGAATVEVTVFLDEFEGIGGPVRAEGFDDVEVPDEKDGFAFSGSVKTRDEIFLAFVRPGYFDIARGEASLAQTSGHRFRGGGYIAYRIGGIDLNKLFENVVRQLLRLILSLSTPRGSTARDQTK